jgi:hypothetical protein
VGVWVPLLVSKRVGYWAIMLKGKNKLSSKPSGFDLFIVVRLSFGSEESTKNF